MEINAIQALESSDANVRNQAALALGAAPDASFADAQVRAMLAEPEAFALETMIWAIVANRDATLPLLINALDRDDVDAERILHALSKIGDPVAIPGVRRFTSSDNPKYAGKAWWALARIGDLDTVGDILVHLGVQDPFLRESLTRALVQWGHEIVPAVIDALKEMDDPAARKHAAEVLIRIVDPDARGTVARRNHELTPGVQAAIQELTHSTLPEVDETLRLLASDPDHIAISKTAQEILSKRN